MAARGSFSLALSGGTSPRAMYRALAEHDIDWEAVDIFQVDERIAPDRDDQRNLTHLRAGLPAAAVERLRPMPVWADDPADAADEYAAQLPDALDLVHLGLGPDGHTASLVPGDAVLDVVDRIVALTAGEYQGRRRMTLTYPALAGARRIVWLVTGEGDRDALAGLRSSDPAIPAGRVSQERATLVSDRAAAG